MKANELRLGNWVKREYQPEGFQIDHNSFMRIEAGNVEYEPIPLTEQWLKDFGFIKINPTRWMLSPRKGDTTILCKLNEWFYMEFNEGVYIGGALKYVHQLQNLYFALTGKELTK
tara:strand:- start:5418 stop:5762 length:345 start_codon:yes stop_codon:yes gene_type:complete